MTVTTLAPPQSRSRTGTGAAAFPPATRAVALLDVGALAGLDTARGLYPAEPDPAETAHGSRDTSRRSGGISARGIWRRRYAAG
jgi:hypothetical protein